MKRSFALALLAACACAGTAYADSSVPAEPTRGGDWTTRCMARLERARLELAREEPAFASGTVTWIKKKREVRFEAQVRDPEHGRFYRNAFADFVVSIVEQRSAEPGAIGADIGTARDSQASIGLTQWSTERRGRIDANVVDGARAFRFSRFFKPALTDCLK
jgi:hypothetical protein